MAGFLSMLPGLFGSMLKSGGSDKTMGLLDGVMGEGKSSGLFGSIGKGIGNVLSDIGGGKVNSWGDFGRSVAKSAAPVFGYEVGTSPASDSKVSSSIEINKKILEDSPSAAVHRTMIVPEHPKPAIAPFMSQYKAPEVPMSAPADSNGQHTDAYGRDENDPLHDKMYFDGKDYKYAPLFLTDSMGNKVKPKLYYNRDSDDYEVIYRNGQSKNDIFGNFIDPNIMTLEKVANKRPKKKNIGKKKHKSLYSKRK
jgi:hypothetical protein